MDYRSPERIKRLISLPPIDLKQAAKKQQEAKLKLEKERDQAHLKLLAELKEGGEECNYLRSAI